MNKIIVMYCLFFCSQALFAAVHTDSIISVTGEAEKEVQADKWEVSLSLRFQEADRKTLMKAYQEAKKKMMNSLETLGIKEKELKSQNFWISPWQVYEKNKYVNKGFQLGHNFIYKSENLELVGQALSQLALVKGLEVQGINQQLKKSTLDKINEELYQNSFENAQSKIMAICNASKKKFKNLISIEEVSKQGNFYPMRAMEKSMSAMGAGAMDDSRSSSISLEPATLKVQSELKVVASFIP